MSRKIIAFEGFDGTGKTTLAKWVAKQHGFHYRKSPGGPFDRSRANFDRKEVTHNERFFFYLADSLAISETIRQSNTNMVLDRYFYSTLAYHHALGLKISNEFSAILRTLVRPDIIIYTIADYEKLTNRIRPKDASTNDPLFLFPEFYKKITSVYESFFDVPMIKLDNNGSLSKTKNSLVEALLSHNVVQA